jgi:hypothetical protein
MRIIDGITLSAGDRVSIAGKTWFVVLVYNHDALHLQRALESSEYQSSEFSGGIFEAVARFDGKSWELAMGEKHGTKTGLTLEKVGRNV